MGGAVSTPLPPATAEAFEQLTRAFYRLLEEQKETNRLLRKGVEPPSPWMTGDEAAIALGKIPSKSKEHLRCLKHFRDNGFLTVFGQMKPFTYSREQVLYLKKRIDAEKVFMP
jgi:hypothetical protein